MTNYSGSIFGLNYNIEKNTDAEFIDWLIGKLKAQIPVAVWVQIMTRLLQQSDEYQAARTKIADHEARIRALEGGGGLAIG